MPPRVASALFCVALLALCHPARSTLAADTTGSKADHWAFKPAIRPAIPAVKNPRWPRNPIDNFILARLEQEKLAPSSEADRVTLLRRVSYDLTGLPPAPEDARRFLADKSPDAYERMVDRLLNSPRYGERWARHWLDTVHYGESHGYDKDKPRPNAWPYRDYVIRAFNTDKPYSRFVQEQLAGDVLFPDTADGIVALGFIAAGPWDFVGHVELPESKTDGLIARYNDRDDMVMNTMSTFLSLTVHCARCHDHKFDPISQEEYYGLQAVFAGVDRADRPFDADPQVSARRRRLTSEEKDLEARQKTLEEIAGKVTSHEIVQIDARLAELKEQLKALPQPPKESPGNGYHSGIEARPDIEKWVQVDLGRLVAIDEVRLIPTRPTDFPDTPGFGFPKRFRVETSNDENFARRELLTDRTAEDLPNPGDSPVVVHASGQQARFVRVTATRLWERTHDFVFALAELQVFSGTNNVALASRVTALDSIEAGRWGKTKLVDNFDSRKPLAESRESLEAASNFRGLKSAVAKLESERKKRAEELLDPATRSEMNRVALHLDRLNKEIARLPKPQTVYAAANDFERTGSFLPAHPPRPVHLLKRGDVQRPGPLMTAGALNCVPGLSGELNVANGDDEGSRRAALARWITDSRNMLMRRSIVNRVWQYHFGRGIVDTPNDFGHMGSPPTHPELLDWLAYWFLDHGESLKQLHRLIVTSAAYRQSSQDNPQFSHVDGDDRFLWRMNRERLDAESFRDTLLFLSGRLDLTMGGPSVQQFFFKDDHSPVYDYTRFDVDSPAGSRRSIYRFIVRSVPDPFMESFDCPDANILTPKRSVTLTALQALSTLNDAFVIRRCALFAGRVRQLAPDLNAQIEAVYELALNRRPRDGERKMLINYTGRFGLTNLCRLIVNSNEFMFVD